MFGGDTANMMKSSRLLTKLRSNQYEFLPAKIGLLAFAVGFVIYILEKMLFRNNAIASLLCSEIGAITFLGLLGFAGFVVMVRGELHQVVVIRGKTAKFYGLIWCVFSWGLALKYIVLLFSNISALLK
jgi:hypothetical protein